MILFPNLQLVDLRKNTNIDCQLILELKISVRRKCKTKALLTTQQSLARTTLLPIPSTSLTTQQCLSPTTSLPIPSTFLIVQQSLLRTTSLPIQHDDTKLWEHGGRSKSSAFNLYAAVSISLF